MFKVTSLQELPMDDDQLLEVGDRFRSPFEYYSGDVKCSGEDIEEVIGILQIQVSEDDWMFYIALHTTLADGAVDSRLVAAFLVLDDIHLGELIKI